MPLIDIFLLFVLLTFVLLGFFFGFLRTIGSIIGTIVSFYFANQFIDPVFAFLSTWIGGGAMARIVTFILLYALFSRLVAIVYWLLGKVFRIVSWIPFAKTADRLLGALFGLLEGSIVVGVVLLFAMHVVPKEMFESLFTTSTMARSFVTILKFVSFLLPETSKQILETAKLFISQSFSR